MTYAYFITLILNFSLISKDTVQNAVFEEVLDTTGVTHWYREIQSGPNYC